MQEKSPYKILLNKNKSKNSNEKRSEEEILLLNELLKNNKLFAEFDIPQTSIKEICNNITLIWNQTPYTKEISNQIYLLLDGNAFQYIQSTSMSLKEKFRQNDSKIVVRKLATNDFFLYYDSYGKYKRNNEIKYQVMIDQSTLLCKIEGFQLQNFFFSLFEKKQKKVIDFLKKVQIFDTLPYQLLHDLSRHLEVEEYKPKVEIISRQEKSQFVYFILKGQITFSTYPTSKASIQLQKAVNPGKQKKYILKQHDSFGMDVFNSQTYEEESSYYSAQSKTHCSLYKIDKKILAIIISSFEDDIKKRNRIWSSINLNDQISGQAYQSSEKLVLSRNAQKIKTSEKRIRDIKLRSYNSGKMKNKMISNKNEQFEQFERTIFSQFKNFRSKSSHNVINFKDVETQSKFENLIRQKIPSRTARFERKQRVSQVLIFPYDENKKIQESPPTTPHLKTTISHKKVNFNANSGKREETHIIKGFLDERKKMQVYKKSIAIKQMKDSSRKSSQNSRKRMFSVKSGRIKSSSKVNYDELGEQLFQKLNKLPENPLLFKIQAKRKTIFHETKNKVKTQEKATFRKPTQSILISNF